MLYDSKNRVHVRSPSELKQISETPRSLPRGSMDLWQFATVDLISKLEHFGAEKTGILTNLSENWHTLN